MPCRARKIGDGFANGGKTWASLGHLAKQFSRIIK
jgi:hypothetical protein